MSLKINLKPLPGANYFTVREHLLRREESENADILLTRIEESLRKLFNISSPFKFLLVPVPKQELLTKDKEVILLDDPQKGETFIHSSGLESASIDVLDMSFSFPQISGIDISTINTILIDPRASLGIPADIILVFSRDPKIRHFIDDEFPAKMKNELMLVNRVLKDIEDKGMEMLIRESNYKAAVLNQLIESSPHLEPVAPKEKRSKSMIVAASEHDFYRQMQKLGYELAAVKSDDKTMITIANYPTQSKELIEMFADRVAVL